MPSRSCSPSEQRPFLTPTLLRRWVEDAKLPSFRNAQILHSIYGRGAADFSEMTNVRASLKGRLIEKFRLCRLEAAQSYASADGTLKLLFRVAGGSIETVVIPDGERLTVCVSSQVGCAMGCEFCATARLGLGRNLDIGEIVGQLLEVRRGLESGQRITNVVFMGMGEPLQNYETLLEVIEVLRADWGFGLSSRRITVSTVGLLPQLRKLAVDTDVAIAVSLTAADDALRDRLMPVNRRYPLAQLVQTCRELPIAQRRRITFEYVLLRGVNDGPGDSSRLTELLRGVRAKVNLIPFNPFPGSGFSPPLADEVRDFQLRLLDAGLSATVRKTRGQDVRAACGQLAASAA